MYSATGSPRFEGCRGRVAIAAAFCVRNAFLASRRKISAYFSLGAFPSVPLGEMRSLAIRGEFFRVRVEAPKL